MEVIKKKVLDYWSQRADDFAQQRLREFYSGKHELWMEELKKHSPMDRKLRILDIGTGTGFFAFLLAAEGHEVTGIDLTENMIREARKLSQKLQIPVDFLVMDAENPELEPESFDVLVSRNLTWTLPHLGEAYQTWHKLLKPNGILINFDADYCHENKEQKVPENHAHKLLDGKMIQKYQEIKEELKKGQKLRPHWDEKLLKEAGFSQVRTDLDVWRRIYQDFDEFYNPTPIFKVVASA